jgi:putative Holliday junction resolvase
MARIMAIDYGKKRVGLAVTDPMKMIASGLVTVMAQEMIPYLRKYLQQEAVELFIVGEPKNLDGTNTDATAITAECIRILQKNFPAIPVKKIDERFTSKMAFQSMLQSGMKKKDRQNKALIDEISATILLQNYLDTLK